MVWVCVWVISGVMVEVAYFVLALVMMFVGVFFEGLIVFVARLILHV